MYSDSFLPYLKKMNRSILLPVAVSENCWMSGEQRRPRWDGVLQRLVSVYTVCHSFSRSHSESFQSYSWFQDFKIFGLYIKYRENCLFRIWKSRFKDSWILELYTLRGSKLDLFKSLDKYGKELSYTNIEVKNDPRRHMTLIQRCLNVDATSWRCIDVELTLYKRHVPAGDILQIGVWSVSTLLPLTGRKIVMISAGVNAQSLTN